MYIYIYIYIMYKYNTQGVRSIRKLGVRRLRISESEFLRNSLWT